MLARQYVPLANSWMTEAEEFEQQAKSIRDSINRIDAIVARLEADEKVTPAEVELMTG